MRIYHYLALWMDAKYCDMHICLSARLSVCIKAPMYVCFSVHWRMSNTT